MDATDVTCDRRHVGSPSWWTRLAVGPSKRGRVTTARSLLAAPLLLGLLALTACESEVAQGGTPHRTLAPPSARTWSSPFNEVRGIHKIRHVVVVMQENRSFDSYFGTFPGADGIPMRNGRSVACESPAPGVPCRHLYVDHADVNGGGPHTFHNHVRDVDHGRMDGFLRQGVLANKHCHDANDPLCSNGSGADVLGYHTGSDIPNYWALAHRYVLQDHMFDLRCGEDGVRSRSEGRRRLSCHRGGGARGQSHHERGDRRGHDLSLHDGHRRRPGSALDAPSVRAT